MKTGSGFALALAALALATGCQKAQEKAQETAMEAAIEQATGNKVDIEKDGNAVSIKTNEGDIKIASAAEGGTVALPDGFPGDLHLPAQRRIESAMDMAGMQMVNMQTDMTVAALSQEIEQAMQARGWKREMAMQAGDGSTLVYSKNARQAVYQLAKSDGGGTQLAVRTGHEGG
ncbi:MAG TPA: hypothetical protein PKD02_05230 [Thermomonas sp.]|nr:hypothetical protein [Thermomonas sp.]